MSIKVHALSNYPDNNILMFTIFSLILSYLVLYNLTQSKLAKLSLVNVSEPSSFSKSLSFW